MQVETVAKIKARDFLNKYAEPIGIQAGFEAWILEDGSLIFLPIGEGRIDKEILLHIAESQLRISVWDIDYDFEDM
ncbi:MAG TPA: hypothetical protein VFG10_20750 [Saprospiraceae bacterium]|nr:hypothetical protein [Saprospiraceae bacterium]